MATKETGVYIDGKPYNDQSFTFEELRQLREAIREISGDPVAEYASAEDQDLVPALVYVVTKRDNPDFKIEDALQIGFADERLKQPSRPTKRRS